MDYSYNNNRGGMVTMYEETGSRIRGQDYADYDNSNSRNRRDYRQGRSNSPIHRQIQTNKQRNSRGRDRSRSPHQYHERVERVYDDFAARDFNAYNERSTSNNYQDDHNEHDRGGGYERDHVRDIRESNDRDNPHSDRDRRGQRYRESRDNRSNSRDRYRDNNRDNKRESRDYRDNRDNSRDRRDNRESRNNRDSRENSRDNRDRPSRDRDRNERDDNRRDDNRRDDNRSRHHSRDRDYNRNDEDSSMPPSSTIILQNVGQDCTEEKIESHIRTDGLTFRNVAVIRERNGENKGYAFVEFDDVSTAEKWLKITTKRIIIDGRTIQLNFSRSRRNDPNPSTIPDWHCAKCNVLNFGSRKRHDRKTTCYQCGFVQPDSDSRILDALQDMNSQKDLGSNPGEVVKVEPCNVLMIRGMDFSTTEELIRTAIGALTTRPIFDVRLIRDKVTDMSRGFAFIEMGCVEDATGLLETIEHSDPPFEIVGRRITIGYARHGYNAPLTQKKGKPGVVSKQVAAENAVAQASSAKATSEYSQSVADSYASSGLNNVTDATSVALSTANAAFGGSAVPSTFTYDATSGYYYDTSTSLYYDPNTGYYYNSTTAKWLYWNGSRYQAVNQDGTPVTPSSATPAAAVTAATVTNVMTTPEGMAIPTADSLSEEQRRSVEEKEKVAISFQKPKTARKIAKDMERWAKKMNTATEARKIAVKQAQDELRLLAQKEEELRQQILQEVRIPGISVTEIPIVPKESLIIRSLFVPDNDEEGSVLKLGSALSEPPSQKPKATARVINAEIPEDDDFVDESKFVDPNKIACLLCKRQFASKDTLTKHLQMSQLHKDNLEKYKQTKQQR